MHDFKNFPELANSQMQFYYFDSPHKQILEDFRADVVKVIDGDTIRVKWQERDFDFPVRFVDNAAKELGDDGESSQKWLESQILGEEVDILVDPNNRVEKWGRLLGRVLFRGMDIGELSVMFGHSVRWENRNDGVIPRADS